LATIKDFVALHIKCQLGEDNKFKVEGDILYFEEHIFIPEGPT